MRAHFNDALARCQDFFQKLPEPQAANSTTLSHNHSQTEVVGSVGSVGDGGAKTFWQRALLASSIGPALGRAAIVAVGVAATSGVASEAGIARSAPPAGVVAVAALSPHTSGGCICSTVPPGAT